MAGQQNSNDNGWGQNSNGQWDRWNSNASNNSYYNQPTHKPYDHGFSVAALVMGLLSTTIRGLSIPLGALGILFAMLCYRKGKRLNNNARFGLVLSVFGFLFGIISFVYFIFVQLPAAIKDPAFMDQLNYLYQTFFGMDFNEFLQNYYGIGL